MNRMRRKRIGALAWLGLAALLALALAPFFGRVKTIRRASLSNALRGHASGPAKPCKDTGATPCTENP